jgi:hypothetical protein
MLLPLLCLRATTDTEFMQYNYHQSHIFQCSTDPHPNGRKTISQRNKCPFCFNFVCYKRALPCVKIKIKIRRNVRNMFHLVVSKTMHWHRQVCHLMRSEQIRCRGETKGHVAYSTLRRVQRKHVVIGATSGTRNIRVTERTRPWRHSCHESIRTNEEDCLVVRGPTWPHRTAIDQFTIDYVANVKQHRDKFSLNDAITTLSWSEPKHHQSCLCPGIASIRWIAILYWHESHTERHSLIILKGV